MYLSVDGRDGAGADRNGRRDELPAKAEQTAGDLVNVERGGFCAGATSEQNRNNSTGRVSLASEQKFKNTMPGTAVCCLLWCLFKILAQTFGHKSVKSFVTSTLRTVVLSWRRCSHSKVIKEVAGTS